MARRIYSCTLYYRGNEDDVKSFRNELELFLEYDSEYFSDNYYPSDLPQRVTIMTEEVSFTIFEPLLPLMKNYPNMEFFYDTRDYYHSNCEFYICRGDTLLADDSYGYFVEETDDDKGQPLEDNYDRVHKQEIEELLDLWLVFGWDNMEGADNIGNEEEALALVNKTGYGLKLQYVPEEFRTEKVCLAAVQKDEDAMEYVPKKLQATVKAMLADPKPAAKKPAAK